MAARVKQLANERGLVLAVHGLLAPEECATLVDVAAGAGFQAAPITTMGGFAMRPEVRNNLRAMVDDVPRAAWLWQRLHPFTPVQIGSWSAVGLNERLRYYRYDPGQYFRWHGDGAFVRSVAEESLLTAMIYLNDDFDGGATEMMDGEPVVPETGMAVLFEHSLVHQGAPVSRGTKYVLRTDVMYRHG